MTSLAGFTPEELGLPQRFAEFRPAQISAIEHALNSTRRYIPMALPLGSGKSLIAIGIARASGLRTVILTATKGLMQQYVKDFSESGLVEIKGRSNYQCQHYPNLDCRYGQLESCPLISQGCTYECNRDSARQSLVIVSNYAYWFHVNEYPPGLDNPATPLFPGRPVEQLILDESHGAAGALSTYLQTEIRETWLHRSGLLPPRFDSIECWREFALNNLVACTHQLSSATKQLKLTKLRQHRDLVHDLDSLAKSLTSISIMDQESWVLEPSEGTRYGRRWVFDNIWPAAHSFKLFRAVPKIILMSGTLRPTSMTMLGVKPDQYDFEEWPRVFPPENTPVYFIPTVKMNYKTDEAGMEKWVRRIDEIIESRLDRKGIIHTVSYARQAYLLDHSRYRAYMVANTNDPESETAAQVVTSFRAMDAPGILVSPSFSTGWDFPGRDCEWQIIGKIPYPDIRSKIIEARSLRQPSYASHLAMQDLEQACGRGSRSYDDRCEIFIVDNAISYLLYRYPHLKSRWFTLIQVNEVPEPGPRSPDLSVT